MQCGASSLVQGNDGNDGSTVNNIIHSIQTLDERNAAKYARTISRSSAHFCERMDKRYTHGTSDLYIYSVAAVSIKQGSGMN